MPIFDFKCTKCGHVQEEIISPSMQNFTPDTCEKCGEKNTMEKQFSADGQSFDVVGGYSYTYGKKSVLRDAQKHSDCLVKDASGNYKNPY